MAGRSKFSMQIRRVPASLLNKSFFAVYRLLFAGYEAGRREYFLFPNVRLAERNEFHYGIDRSEVRRFLCAGHRAAV